MGEIQLVLGPMFSGKCLAAGTLVLRANGDLARVEEMKVGDELLGDDLKPRKVLQTAAGFGGLIRVCQSNACSYVVNDCHILSVKKRGQLVFKDVPVADFESLGGDWVGYTVTPPLFCGMTPEERLAKPEGCSGSRERYYSLLWSLSPGSGGANKTFLTEGGVRGMEQDLHLEEAGSGGYFGFVLDGNGRFVLGCCAVTHNTTELCRRGRRYSVSGKSCVYVKHSKDVRYAGNACLVTHDQSTAAAAGALRTSDGRTLVVEKLMDHFGALMTYDVILIDEGQFFDDLDEFAEQAANLGKIVVVAALDGDFNRRPFGRIPWMLSLAEDVTKLSAVCVVCHENAAFSLRTVASQELVLVGGKESYVAVCRKCHHERAKIAAAAAPQ